MRITHVNKYPQGRTPVMVWKTENWGLKCNVDVWLWLFFLCDDASYLPVICFQNERQIVARADGGGQELLFVPMPDTGPLQHKSGNSLISICSQGSCVSRAHATLRKCVPRLRNLNFPHKSNLLTQRIQLDLQRIWGSCLFFPRATLRSAATWLLPHHKNLAQLSSYYPPLQWSTSEAARVCQTVTLLLKIKHVQ